MDEPTTIRQTQDKLGGKRRLRGGWHRVPRHTSRRYVTIVTFTRLGRFALGPSACILDLRTPLVLRLSG